MKKIAEALLTGLLAWIFFAAIGVAVMILVPLWPWSAILGMLMFLGSPLPALLVFILVLLRDEKEC